MGGKVDRRCHKNVEDGVPSILPKQLRREEFIKMKLVNILMLIFVLMTLESVMD